MSNGAGRSVQHAVHQRGGAPRDSDHGGVPVANDFIYFGNLVLLGTILPRSFDCISPVIHFSRARGRTTYLE